MNTAQPLVDDAQPQLIVLNQFVGPAFLDWLVELAAVIGPVELWSGNAPNQAGAGVAVRRLCPYDNSSATSRITTWGRFTLAATWRLLRQGGRTPLFVVTNPPLMPLAARWLRTLQQRPYGLLEWDIYPHILAAMGLIGPRHVIYRLWRQVHASTLRRASLIVTIGQHMARTLQGMANDGTLSIAVVPNWVDTDRLKPLPRDANPFVQEQSLLDKLVVLYSGNLGATHPVEVILEVAQLLADEPGVCFLIIGEGSKRNLVETAVAQGRAPNVRLLDRQPESQLPYTLSSGDIGIVALADGYEGLSMPSKTYSLMAAGNAILGISRPPDDISETIAHHGCGAHFHPDEPMAIAGWIRGLLADPVTLAHLQARSRAVAVAEYSAQRCPARLTDAVVASLVDETTKRYR